MKKIKIFVSVLLMLSFATAYAAEPTVDSKSSLLMEVSSNKILYENNSDERVPIASVTKIMTVLLAMEAIERGELSYTDKVTASAYAESMGGSQIFLAAGEEMTVDEILKAIVVASGNDAAVALAEHIGGTYENFIKMMNDRAASLGLKNTHFVDANGLSDDANHYSSAHDVAVMSCELMKHKDIKKYTLIRKDTLRNGEFNLVNTNDILRTFEGATGLKTGYTSEALFCLVATAERNGVEYCSVVLGAPSTKERFEGCERLLQYGYDNFIIADKEASATVLGEVKVTNGKADRVNAVIKNDATAIIKKDAPSVERRITLKEKIKAPVNKGDVIGKIEFVSGNEIVESCDLVAEETVEKKSFFDVFSMFFECFLGVF